MTAARDDGAPLRLAGLVLAAGESARLGQPKQLVNHGGQTLLLRVVRQAFAVCNAGVVVVTGAKASSVERSLAELPRQGEELSIVYNPEWRLGMGSSIACGVRALFAGGAGGPDGVLMLLCDQPGISRDELVALVNLWQTDAQRAAAAHYNAAFGVPAIFPQGYRAALEKLTGEVGARRLLAAATGVLKLEMPSASFDVDTPADLDKLNHRWQYTD